MLGGISGFPSPRESEHDAFIAGHGNTSLSAAIGMAQAKKLRHEPGKVIAVVGDGAFTGGMIYEGMNNIRSLNNLIVVLNDNKNVHFQKRRFGGAVSYPTAHQPALFQSKTGCGISPGLHAGRGRRPSRQASKR